jgi:hypothetical protein
MKKNYLLSIILLSTVCAKAQFDKSSDWTWMSGDSTVNNSSFYGIRGIPSPLNKPGSRYYSSTWVDTSGNLWLFGGYSNYPNSVIGFLNDLWKYDVASGEWTWVNGDTTASNRGIYGTKGISDVRNSPGGRYSPATWVDSNGDLFLFGGNGMDARSGTNGDLNDVWKYNISTNQWTWINGDTTINIGSIFGQKAVSSPLNKPGGRSHAAYWQDSTMNVWIFGGYTARFGISNELWKYESDLNQWIWITGDSNIYSIKKFGVKGVESPLNTINGKYRSAFWKDTLGNFWICGGRGYDRWNGVGLNNDLWRYRPSTSNWTWMSGDTVVSSPGVYGTLGIPGNLNKPGGREGCVSWSDNHGDFYLFGGYGIAEAGSAEAYLADLWKFEPLKNQWTWIKGEKNQNATGLYGTRGISTVGARPVARYRDVSWNDLEGNLWLFGGKTYGVVFSYLNDLWKLGTSKCKIITWTGIHDSAWENPLNWSCGIVPDVYSIVIINSGNVVINSNVIIESLSVTASNVQINGNFTLTTTH